MFVAGAPDDDHVNLMPLLRLRESPGDLVLRLPTEEGIGYAELTVRAELQESIVGGVNYDSDLVRKIKSLKSLIISFILLSPYHNKHLPNIPCYIFTLP